MTRPNLNDLTALAAVAEARSFTRAAARLGLSPSALSHAIRGLEERLGVRLLTRTTRSVATTEAGERLLESVRPALSDIDGALASLAESRDKPAGTIRLTLSEHAANTLVWPVLEKLLPLYPDLNVELSIDSAFTDIVANRFDAGIRLGEALAQDMVAVKIGPELRMVVVGSPEYLAANPAPLEPADLAAHRCINVRMKTSGGIYAWELSKNGHEVRVRVEGQLVLNGSNLVIRAACAGTGLACLMEDSIAAELASGRLVTVLDDWCEPFAGYHIYFPSRRQLSPALALLVKALRHR